MRALFWKGLKKSADHTKSGTKCLLEHRDLLKYQSVWAGTGSRAGERDAVVAAVAFYGGRRMAEVPALHRKDVKPKGDFAEVNEKKQKNDPYRRGMRCWIPQFPRLGPLCPFGLLRAWLCQWDETWNQCVSEGNLFFVAASDTPKAVCYDTVRKSLQGECAGPRTGRKAQRGSSSPEVSTKL